MGGFGLLEGVTEKQIGRLHGDGFVEQDTVIFGCHFGDVGDIGAGRLKRLGVDGIFGDGDDIGAIFDLEFERSPLQAVGDEVTPHTGGFLFSALQLDDDRVNFVMVAVIRDDVDDCLRIRYYEDLFFEGALFHGVIILEMYRSRFKHTLYISSKHL